MFKFRNPENYIFYIAEIVGYEYLYTQVKFEAKKPALNIIYSNLPPLSHWLVCYLHSDWRLHELLVTIGYGHAFS